VKVRIIPEKATEIAELLSGGVDIIKAVPPDQMDVINKSGSARTATSPILRTAMLQLDQAARGGPNPFTDRKVRQAGGAPGSEPGSGQPPEPGPKPGSASPSGGAAPGRGRRRDGAATGVHVVDALTPRPRSPRPPAPCESRAHRS